MWNSWLVPNPQAASGCFDGEIIEERLHIDTDSFVVTVDAGPVRGFASHAGAAQPGEDRGDDLVAQGEQGGDRALGSGASAAFVLAREDQFDLFGRPISRLSATSASKKERAWRGASNTRVRDTSTWRIDSSHQ